MLVKWNDPVKRPGIDCGGGALEYEKENTLVNMKRTMTRGISLILCALLTLGMFGCSATAKDSNPQTIEPEAGGRYIESEIKLPIPEGFSEQSILGVGSYGNEIHVFTNTYSGTEDQVTVHYFRHTIQKDGSISTTSEQVAQRPCADWRETKKAYCRPQTERYT